MKWRTVRIVLSGALCLLVLFGNNVTFAKAQTIEQQTQGPCFIVPNPDLVITLRNPDGGNITVDFDPEGRTQRKHRGIDLGMHKAYPVYASYAGTLVFKVNKDDKLYNNTGGALVWNLDSPWQDYQIQYFHQNVFLQVFQDLKVGQHLDQGQYLGEVDGSGISDGPHLHFELHYKGRPVNPKPFFNCTGSYSQISSDSLHPADVGEDPGTAVGNDYLDFDAQNIAPLENENETSPAETPAVEPDSTVTKTVNIGNKPVFWYSINLNKLQEIFKPVLPWWNLAWSPLFKPFTLLVVTLIGLILLFGRKSKK